MHQRRYVFAQLMEHLPLHALRRAVKRYDGERYVKRFSCLDQFLCMAFAQLAGRESLREIEICLRAHHAKLYHLGIRGGIARSTLADANERRDWRIYAEFAQQLIATARRLYVDEPLGVELAQTAYALDSTTIELCLSVFPWARATPPGLGGIKLHTLLDVHGAIPTLVHVSAANLHDIHMLDLLVPEPGALYLMDRGYLDFARLYHLHCQGAFFLMRAKRNLRVRRRYSVSALYRHRWQIEIFFKWIKQHLRIKAFFGTSPNAVKTQVWIAVAVYVLIAIVRKRLNSAASLSELLQILSVTLFERTPLARVFAPPDLQNLDEQSDNQLNLFEY